MHDQPFDQVQLKNLMEDAFNLDELTVIAFELEVDWESLAGNTRPLKIIALISYFQRRGQLDKLLTVLQQHRPDGAWPKADPGEGTSSSVMSGELQPDSGTSMPVEHGEADVAPDRSASDVPQDGRPARPLETVPGEQISIRKSGISKLWERIANASKEVKAALITGIFTVIVAIIALFPPVVDGLAAILFATATPSPLPLRPPIPQRRHLRQRQLPHPHRQLPWRPVVSHKRRWS